LRKRSSWKKGKPAYDTISDKGTGRMTTTRHTKRERESTEVSSYHGDRAGAGPFLSDLEVEQRPILLGVVKV
jgi:hypothetical protein